MKIKMQLLSDTIFGNGESIPGGEDISVLCDFEGFPYYKGGSFKGIFREELLNYYSFTGLNEKEAKEKADKLLGFSGDDGNDSEKLFFSDFCLSSAVKNAVLSELSENPDAVLDATTNIRTFTAIGEEGIVKQHSLRTARCVNKGLCFYSEILCNKEDEALVKEVLSLIKWIGSLRNRGFGKILITVVE